MTRFLFDRLDSFGNPGHSASATEADVRDTLAACAHLAGWQVRTELPVDNGGRADLVVWSDSVIIAVEVKLELRTTRQFRLAFQQADGYRRHFAGGKFSHAVRAMVVAPNIEWSAGQAISQQYPEIELGLLGDFADRVMYLAPTPDVRRTTREREQLHRWNSHRCQYIERNRSDMLRMNHLCTLRRNYPAAASLLESAIGIDPDDQRITLR